MAYQRFRRTIPHERLATVATVATVQPEPAPSVANVARGLVRNHDFPTSSVAIVATVNPGQFSAASPTPALVHNLDEREAMALGGGVPAPFARAFAEMQAACPPGVLDLRWQQATNDAGLFLDQWSETAERLGWTAGDLFGLHPTVPLSRVDHMGLVWLLKGERVVSLTATEARLERGLTYYRQHRGRRAAP
jgi:hypothetical protein